MSYSLHPNSESRRARQAEMAALREEAERIAADALAAAETFDPEDASPTTEPFTEELKDYASMTVAELKALCAERGLTVSGTKAELIARLAADDEPSDSTEAPVEEAAAEEDTATPVEETAVASKTQEGEVSESEGEKERATNSE